MNARHLFVGACLLAAALPIFDLRPVPPRPEPGMAVRPGSATTRAVAVNALAATGLRDRPLTQQPLTALETRFAADFPGAIARYRTGDAALIVREVTQPTRQLHPASDCFRAVGYALGTVRTHEDARHARWNCFEARLGTERWRVCERIVDAAGRQWTDVSSWYWSALWSQPAQGAGPWWAVTLVRPLTNDNSSEDDT
jgi:hypothetical protein